MSNGPRKLKKRIDEVVRTVLWHRIAPPYAAGHGFVRIDREIFTDSWIFRPEDMWWKDLYGHTAHQGAPARIARNMDLSEVAGPHPKPFVVAARYPNGAVSVGSMGRATAPQGWEEPRADVTIYIADAKGPIGVFGHFVSLKVVTDSTLTGSRWLAQDLLATSSIDITHQVRIDDHSVTVPGQLLAQIGLSGATRGDLSDPGLILAWT